MHRNTQRKLPAFVVALVIGTLLSGGASAGQADQLSNRHAEDSQFKPTANFSGRAEVGSKVHDWISSMIRPEANYTIPYSITVSGELAQVGFSGPEEIVALAKPQSLGASSVHSSSGSSKVNTYDPVDYIPSPSEPGTPGSDIGGTQCYTGFGSTFPAAHITYEWTWMQTDTNNSGGIDSGDQWGWHLTSYSVEFLAENISIDPESCQY